MKTTVNKPIRPIIWQLFRTSLFLKNIITLKAEFSSLYLKKYLFLVQPITQTPLKHEKSDGCDDHNCCMR